MLAIGLAASVLLAAAPGSTGAVKAASVVAPAACLQQGPCVIVQVVQGTSVVQTQYFYAGQVVDQGEFTADNRQSVPTRCGTDAVVERGSSLSRLIGLVVDPAKATYAEVVNDEDGYGRHLLTKDELAGGGFPGGLVPAVYVTDPGAPVRFNYVRPLRGADDDNCTRGPDWGLWFSDERGPILVQVHLTGGLLDVDVNATPTDDSNRTFALGSDPTGAGYAFDWHLPGGGTAVEATPTYTFPADSLAGSYPVTVGVEKNDGSFGWGSTLLQVGPKATASESPSPTPGTGGNGPASSGPTKNPSGSPNADPNPDEDGGDGETPTEGPPTLPPSTASTGQTSGPDDGSSQGPAEQDPPPTKPTETPEPGSAGDSVTGILLTAAQAEEASGAVVSDALPPSQAARPLSNSATGVSTWVWGGLGAVLLLLAGAGSESARLRGWLKLLANRRWSRMST